MPDAPRIRDKAAPRAHPLARLHATWLYAHECDRWDVVDGAWPQIRQVYRDFVDSGWSLDPARGDVHANAYLAGLIAFERIAGRHDEDVAANAAERAEALAEVVVDHLRRGADKLSPEVLEGLAGIDALLAGEGPLFLQVESHRCVPAKLLDLTPEVAALLTERAPGEAALLLGWVDQLMPGWYLTAEERQVHHGENLMDFPSTALAFYEAKAWVTREPPERLAAWIDMPWCPGDLTYIRKLVACLGRVGTEGGDD
jgi:hypothetical protein